MKKLFLALLFAPSLVFAQSAAYNLSQLAHQLLSGGTVPVSAGGTGITSLLGYANDCLVVNTGATGFSFATCGSGNVTDGAGTTTSNELLLSSTTAHTYSLSATLPISALPALTGDVTSSAGSNSVTVSKVGGYTWPAPVNGDVLGFNGTALTWVTNGGGSSLPTCTLGQLVYYAANGSAVSCLTLGTNLSITGGTLNAPFTEAVNAQTGTTYTVATTDCGKQLTFSNASAIAVSVPQANGSFATCQFDVTDLGAGTATLTPTTSTINGSASLAVAQNRQCTVNSDGTNWQVIGCTALVSGGGSGITLENAGSSLGTITTLNCSTGTTCSASGGVGTLTASGGSSATAISFGIGSISQNLTDYAVPGYSSTAGLIALAVVPRSGTLQDLYLSVQNAPASGQTFIITLYTGTVAGSLTATTVTCTISNPNKSCSDTTDTASIAAGSSWDVQIVTSATSGNTGVVGVGIQLQ